MILPEGTLSGVHQQVGESRDANCALMLEFGSDPDLYTNGAIAERLLLDEGLRSLPLFVSGSLKRALEERGAIVDIVHSFQGPSAGNFQENLGTFGELEQFRDNRDPEEHSRPVVITNGHNVGNVLRQAGILGIREGMIVPPRLPRNFDRRSKQVWTKGKLPWLLGALPRHLMLLGTGH
jgi:hypothetical protein